MVTARTVCVVDNSVVMRDSEFGTQFRYVIAAFRKSGVVTDDACVVVRTRQGSYGIGAFKGTVGCCVFVFLRSVIVFVVSDNRAIFWVLSAVLLMV
jgi:hypothetical protein